MGLFDLFSRRESPDEPGAPEPPGPRRTVEAYHDRTKHHLHRFAYGPFELDWATQPDPFRRYEGAPLVPLEARSPERGPRLDAARIEGRVDPEPLDRESLSAFLFDALAISAWKEAGGSRWSLRVNPSSGNLHPTEAYLLLPPVAGVVERPSVVHYAPREHGLERRAEIPDALWSRVAAGLEDGAFLVGLTSVHWREAWKYGERAYRYCHHDVGHAIAAVAFAAAGLGWRVRLVDDLATDELAQLLGVASQDGPEAEQADALLLVTPRDDSRLPHLDAELCAAFGELERTDTPNALSPDHVEWDVIDAVAEAARKPRTEPVEPAPRPAPSDREERDVLLRPVVRGRRSCLSLDGRTSMTADAFYRMLEATLARAGTVPFGAFPERPRLDLALFVHRVDGLEPGLYWLQRDPDRADAVRAALRDEFRWETPPGCPDELPLAFLWPGDLRSRAMQVSCQQDIAGDGAFSLGMIAEFADSLAERGAWIYPRLFWEAGAIGQVLYLEAEAAGLRSTGIGCFFDDAVHALLGLRGHELQSLYHFTVGRHVEDPRLTTLPAYPAP